jgi:hypothetical protein
VRIGYTVLSRQNVQLNQTFYGSTAYDADWSVEHCLEKTSCMTLITQFRTRIMIPYQTKDKCIKFPAILLRSSSINSVLYLKAQITKTMYNLLNRKVLVTGASRGLGAVIAKAFAQEGCDFAITYLASEAKAEAVASEIRSSTGRQVVTIQAVSYKKKFETISADLEPPRNYLSSPNAKELSKKQSKPLEDLTLSYTML